MKPQSPIAAVSIFVALHSSFAFEGHIRATLGRGGDTQNFVYTVGTNQMRIECTGTDRPNAKNIVDLDTGAITLLFPHNRSFVRLKATNGSGATPLPPGVPASRPMSTMSSPPDRMPPGIGPQPGGVGMPAMPMMPPMPMEPLELKAAGQMTNLLGYTCTRYELKQGGEVMEIWATDRLLPFQKWLPIQPHRFGPRPLEEQWAELLKAKKLFPLLAVLKFENGPERLRFEVRAITTEKIEDPKLFQPSADYFEIQPLPF